MNYLYWRLAMNMYIILFLAITLNASANIMLKIGMNRAGSFSFTDIPGIFTEVVLNPFIIGGVFCFVLALAAYTYVLSKINLSVAYPIMTSVGYMIVILASWLFLNENISGVQVIGFCLIIGGVWLVAV